MKLITLNIEGDRHLERVVPFVERENPDVLCLQEVFSDTLPEFSKLGYTHLFLPMAEKMRNGVPAEWGIALCTKGTLRDQYHTYYRDVVFEHDDPVWKKLHERGVTKNSFKNGILGACITVDGAEYVVSTTHFTWAPHGETASPEQMSSMDGLLAYISKRAPHLLCGDFNIPRLYNPLYRRLVEHYTDTVPEHITSSLDKNFHRLGSDPGQSLLFSSFMVDYIFSQPPYVVSDVRLEFGISDHAAVVGTVTQDKKTDA